MPNCRVMSFWNNCCDSRRPIYSYSSSNSKLCTILRNGYQRSTIRKISLITSYDDNNRHADMHAKLDELKQSLLEIDVELDINLNPKIHDREIRFNNGWVIKIGRGLDFYQKPGGGGMSLVPLI